MKCGPFGSLGLESLESLGLWGSKCLGMIEGTRKKGQRPEPASPHSKVYMNIKHIQIKRGYN